MCQLCRTTEETRREQVVRRALLRNVETGAIGPYIIHTEQSRGYWRVNSQHLLGLNIPMRVNTYSTY